ncbi:type IV pilin protein [Desulfoluna sp.]|uniref:type IV pilin protein n=1 Tax=Desulfoluna sp. TaxID=2045199 RepID=UPI00263610E2|nr:type IV pilin protein [Desulfoluna sp.]
MKSDSTNQSDTNGFTLIELLIVVAIIGLLAAVAIPNYSKVQCKSKQAEAKKALNDIRTAQEAYYAESDSYASRLISLNYFPRQPGRYTISIVTSSRITFTAQASGFINNKLDSWSMDEQGLLKNTQPGCSN